MNACPRLHPRIRKAVASLDEVRALGRRDAIEIRIGDVPLEKKLDALGAAIAAVREAHREVMSPASWAALHRSQEAIAEAILTRNDRRLIG